MTMQELKKEMREALYHSIETAWKAYEKEVFEGENPLTKPNLDQQQKEENWRFWGMVLEEFVEEHVSFIESCVNFPPEPGEEPLQKTTVRCAIKVLKNCSCKDRGRLSSIEGPLIQELKNLITSVYPPEESSTPAELRPQETREAAKKNLSSILKLFFKVPIEKTSGEKILEEKEPFEGCTKEMYENYLKMKNAFD